uniref:Protein FAR1-RELATED SEQUENCE n=2 Tax=Aegilops tauschii subsp. strangulata TaxID=200361 RepID=A0A453IXE2_AEGTS
RPGKGSMACAATAPFAGGVAMEADGGLEFLLDPVDRFPLREESADNLEHPDPVPLALLPRREIRGRKNASPTRSPQSTGEVNHEAPGWTKVEAGEYTALEQSIQKYAEEPSKSVVKPELGLSFDLSGEAYDFYNLYSWVVGFGIRYGKSRLNDKSTKIMQEILSGCAGKPEVKNSRSCRCSDKTSLYDMPFGLFVRVNHHFQSVILVGVCRIS